MIKVMGYSDDSVYVYENEECVGVDDDCADLSSRVLLVGTAEAGLVVRVCYAPKCKPPDGPGTNGTWQVAVDLVDEDVRIPWPVRIENGDRGYTPALVIDCPKGTPWRWLARAENGDDE